MHQYYNPEKKIWCAPQNGPIFNPSAGLGDIIWYSLNRNKSKVAQIYADDESQLTYGELRDLSVRVSVNLGTVGITAGDVVAVAGRNNKEIAAVVFGCFFIGAPVNPLDPSFEKDDLAHMFGITKPKLVVCEESNLAHVEAALLEQGLTAKVLIFGRITSTLLKPTVRLTDLDNFIPVYIRDCATTTALIMCSSGTTGASKGVCISHAQANTRFLQSWHILESDRTMVFSSLYWLSGILILLEGTVIGATRVLTEKPFTPEYQIELIEKYKMSHMFSPPSHLAAILESSAMQKADLSSIRLFLTGGSLVPEGLRQDFENHLPNGIVRNVYGMTEIGVATTTILNHRALSVGQLKIQAVMKIMDDDGNLLGPMQQGQVVVKIPYPFIGYKENPEQTAEVMDAEGWIYTGDLGYFDDDAFLFIVGRSKEIIKYRGYQISPGDLEEFLQKETRIQQVCVIGIEDKRVGTDLPAAVLIKGNSPMTAAEIQKLSAEKLPDYKQLRGGVYFVDKFPMTPSGKIKRKALKEIIERNHHQM